MEDCVAYTIYYVRNTLSIYSLASTALRIHIIMFVHLGVQTNSGILIVCRASMHLYTCSRNYKCVYKYTLCCCFASQKLLID